MKAIWINFRTHNSSHTYSIKTTKIEREQCRAAWQKFIAARRIMPKQEQRNKPDVPPGGREWTARRFLEKSRKLKSNSAETDGKGCSFNQTRHNAIYIYLKHQWQLSLPGFLAKFELICLSLHQNLPSLCFPLQPLWFQPHYLTLSAPILWKTFSYD